jgi:hypothetical protein
MSVKELQYNRRMNDWKHDIDHFVKLQNILSMSRTEALRTRIITTLNNIKERWPRELKNEIIPDH